MIAEALLMLTVTSYNPIAGQTDSSPCIGASGVDLCEYKRRTGERPIALSQDLVGRLKSKKFHYGDYVWLESDIPACNGQFTVLDTMNKRFKKRGDIFFLERKNNTSCVASITKLLRIEFPQRKVDSLGKTN